MLFRFGEFEADAERFCVTKHGAPIAIEPKPLRLLLHLLSRHPAVVPREELVEALWPTEQVTPDSLTRAVRGVRSALDAPGVIRSVRSHGYGVAVAVERVLPAANSAVSATDRVFVGREDVLRTLGEAFAAATRGRGSVALLVGEPGIGKTRTAEEFAREARAAGAEVLWGRTLESGGMTTLWPWLQVLRSLVRARSPAALRAVLGPGAAELGALVPELRERLPKLPPPPPLPLEQSRFRFFDTVAQLLVRASEERPIVLVFDDLQWADANSLQLLSFLAGELHSAHVLVIGTLRHVAAPPNAALDATLGELSRLPTASPPQLLGGLSISEVEQLLRTIPGAPSDRADARRIHSQTDGNPFFVQELGRLAGATATGPTRVSAVIRQRLQAVGAELRELLEVGSVVGRELPVELLEPVLELPRGVVWDRLEEAQQAGFLEEDIEQEMPAFRFVHAIVQETVYDQVRHRRRMELHLGVGLALEALHRGDLEPYARALSHHFAQAAPLGVYPRAADYAEMAAHQARAHFAFEEAGRGYARALELLAEDDDPRRRCDLLLDLGEAMSLAGVRVEATSAFRRAADLARTYADGERLTRAALGFANASEDIFFADPESLALLQESLESEAEESSPLRIAALGRLAVLQLAVDQRAENEARAAAEKMIQAARGMRDPSTLTRALLDRLMILQLRPLDSPAEERMEAATAAIRAAHEATREDLELEARRQRIAIALELGDPEQLDADIGLFARQSDRVCIRSQRHHAASYLAMRALQRGCFDDAQVWIDAAERLADPGDPREAFFTPLTQRLLLPRAAEPDVAIEAAIRRCIEMMPLVHWRTALARFYFDAGRESEAADVLDRVLAEGFPATLERNVGWSVAMASIAHVVAGLGWRDQAPGLFEAFEPFAKYNVVVGLGIGCLGPTSYYLGDLAVTAERYDEATVHLDSALEMTARMGARPWEAHVRLARARLERDRGRCDAARAEIDRVCELSTALGMRQLGARARALLA